MDQTHEGLTVVNIYRPQEEFPVLRQDPLRHYRRTIATTAPELADRLTDATMVGRLRGSGSQLNFYRQATGPGWVLLGDAGCTRDSIMGTGIGDAFQQADLLTNLITPYLREPAPLDTALARFATDRHAILDPSYEASVEQAGLHVNPAQVDYLRWVRTDPAETARFVETLTGTKPRPLRAAT